MQVLVHTQALVTTMMADIWAAKTAVPDGAEELRSCLSTR